MYFFSSRTKKVESTWASFENNSPTDGSTCTFWESFPRTFYTTQTAHLKGQKAPATLRIRCKICSIALCCHRAEKGKKQECAKRQGGGMLFQPFFHLCCTPSPRAVPKSACSPPGKCYLTTSTDPLGFSDNGQRFEHPIRAGW